MLTAEYVKSVKERINAAAEAGDIGALIEALKEEEWKLRQEACFALGKMGGAAVEPLIAVVQDAEAGDYARGHAILALEAIGDARAVEPLLSAAEDEAWLVRGYAAKTLRSFQDDRAEAILIQVYERDDNEKCTVRNAAVESLAALSCVGSLEFLRGVIENDPDRGVKASARRAVAALEAAESANGE